MSSDQQDPSLNPSPKGPEQKLGRGMLIIGWVLALGVATLLVQQWQQKRHNPNAMPEASQANGVNEVVLKRNPQHHYLANGYINGKPVTFLLDTGATDVAIPGQLARKLGLERGVAGYARTANGTTRVYATVLDELTLGSITLYDVRASITEGFKGEEILLGMSALKNVEFTHRNGTLVIRQYY